jgi:predicted esterase
MKYSALLLFTLLLLHSASATASEKIIKDTLVSQNKERSFYLFVPGSVKPGHPAPLIVLLHGSGRNGLSLVEKWKDLAAKEGIILVGPDATDSNGWSTPADGPAFLHDLVESLKSKYPVNPRRVYLFGHSAGAVFALMMSMEESEYFAATAIHAGAWRPDDYRVADELKRKIPIAIWVGTIDQYFPLSAVRATKDALLARGLSVELTEMPGHDHWYYDLAPQINQNAWAFLQKHELQVDPYYAEYGDAAGTAAANRAVVEINILRNKANYMANQINQKEMQIIGRDPEKDRAEVNKLAQEEVAIIKETMVLWREAAEKAEAASGLSIADKFKRYLALVGQQSRKSAEASDVMRGAAEALLSLESVEAIRIKRAEAQKRVEKLQQEVDELEKRAEEVIS